MVGWENGWKELHTANKTMDYTTHYRQTAKPHPKRPNDYTGKKI